MSPGGARYSLTSRLAVAAMAGYGLAWPRGCGRWLPVRLPGISLAALTSGRPGCYWPDRPDPSAAADHPSPAYQGCRVAQPGVNCLDPGVSVALAGTRRNLGSSLDLNPARTFYRGRTGFYCG